MLWRALACICGLALVAVQVPSSFAENAAPSQPRVAAAKPGAYAGYC